MAILRKVVKQAAKFCDEHSALSECSTRAIITLIRVKDDPVRERAISLAENALNASTPTGGKKVKSLTEREIKKIIQRAGVPLPHIIKRRCELPSSRRQSL